MDGYTVHTSEFLGSPLHHVNGHVISGFQPSPSVPLSSSRDQLEKVTMINGCKHGFQMGDDHPMRLSPLPYFSKDPGSGTVGPRTLCVEFLQRPRSHSMGLAVTSAQLQESRSHSRDSLASCGSLLDEYQLPGKDGSSEEALVEVTCKKFTRLSTGNVESPHSVSPVAQCREFNNLSRSPPLRDPDVVRKYSFGSHMLTAKRQLSNNCSLSNQHGFPMDLTCKRKKSDASSTSLGSVFPWSGETRDADGSRHDQFEPKEQPNDDDSILKSVLVGTGGRKRSHTLSVCSRQHFRKDSRETSARISPRQRVTLAKRNLGPVMGRMSEYLNRIVQFLSSQVDFVKLSSDDQKNLVTDSVHRLLILYVAEDNLQFVVTPVRDDDDDKAADDGSALEEPTMQFAETVQNFIVKCQAVNISASEYDLMRAITLFHKGSRILANSVEKSNADAQQRLQSLVQQCHPTDRLRYSKLLLGIYTLFGINCPMLEALFCRHLIPGDGNGGGAGGGGGGRGRGGLTHFVLSEFLAGKVANSC